MMYSKKMVLDYICGNDIDDYSIEELEDNYLFMIDVIESTNDKNIYNLCSDNVKNNHEFVKYLITKFKSDGNFICNVVNSYLDDMDEDDIKYMEIVILVFNCCVDNNDDLLSFGAKALSLYHIDRIEIEMLLNDKDNDYWINDSKKGFLIIYEQYKDSKIIMDFFAKKFIEEIFYGGELSFEKLIHFSVKDYSTIEDMGVNNFFINYIRRCDSSLADYVCYNLYLLDNLKSNLVKIKSNWDNYVKRLNQRRIDIIYQEVNEFLEDRDLKFDINQFVIIDIAVKKLGLEEIFYKYDLFGCFCFITIKSFSVDDSEESM